MCLAIVARIVVNRSNHTAFFVAIFSPWRASCLCVSMVSFQPTDLILAALIPMYGMQVFPRQQLHQRPVDEEALMRFSHEDMSRELEEARDEASGNARGRDGECLKNRVSRQYEPRAAHAAECHSGLLRNHCARMSRTGGKSALQGICGDITSPGRIFSRSSIDLLDVAKIEAGRMEVEPQMIETARCLDGALKFVGPKARERNQTLRLRWMTPPPCFSRRAGAETDRHQSGDQFGEIHPQWRQDRCGRAPQRRTAI